MCQCSTTGSYLVDLHVLSMQSSGEPEWRTHTLSRSFPDAASKWESTLVSTGRRQDTQHADAVQCKSEGGVRLTHYRSVGDTGSTKPLCTHFRSQQAFKPPRRSHKDLFSRPMSCRDPQQQQQILFMGLQGYIGYRHSSWRYRVCFICVDFFLASQ